MIEHADFLVEMARESAARVERAVRSEPLAALERRAMQCPAPPTLKLDRDGFDVIAEIKCRAPSVGRLADDARLAVRAVEYVRGGAAAISVLTEPTRFDGSLEHLASVASTVRDARIPVMRKDFLVDPYQVFEARLAGAGGVLLVLRMLTNTSLDEMLECSARCGLFVLLEAFDLADLERAATLIERAHRPDLLVGVNCRDLATLEVDPRRFERFAEALPSGVARVAESGVTTTRDVDWLVALGYELALVGTSLMRSPEPAGLVAELVARGRNIARKQRA